MADRQARSHIVRPPCAAQWSAAGWRVSRDALSKWYVAGQVPSAFPRAARGFVRDMGRARMGGVAWLLRRAEAVFRMRSPRPLTSCPRCSPLRRTRRLRAGASGRVGLSGQPLAGGDVWRPDQAVCSSNWRECECVRLSPQRRAATGLLGPATSGRVVVVRSDNICAVAMVTKLWSGAAATAVMWCGDGGAMGRRTEGRQHRTKGWRCEAAVLERLRVQHSAQALAALPHDSEQQQQRGFPPRPPVAGPRGAGRHCVD